MANGRDSLQARLSKQRVLLGLLQLRPSPLLVELAGKCGYDFLFVDGEHGVFAETDFLSTLQAIAKTNVLGMVRLPEHDTQALRRYVDMGADAIIVPHVSTTEEAHALARAMPPQAKAGLIVIIESALGVTNAEAILAIEGVAGTIIGPTDLSTDLGCKGDYYHPSYAQAFSRIERAAMAAKKFFGTVPHANYPLETLVARGHRLLILGSDQSLITAAMNAQLTEARHTAGT